MTTSYNEGSQDILRNTYDATGNLLRSAAYNGSSLLTQTTTTYNGTSEVLSSTITGGSGTSVASSP